MSDSTFINLHELMQNKGWIPDWQFNETVDLYKYDGCTSVAACSEIGEGDYKNDIINGAWIYHLGKLTNSYRMFYDTTIASFSGDLSSLTNGRSMFYNTAIESFSSDLSTLTDGSYMFFKSALESFNGDLSSLTHGTEMFNSTALQSFNGDLSSLTHGSLMFYKTPLESFNSDLSSLTNGSHMFCNTALTSFSGDLSSLTNGYKMFYNSTLESFSADMPKLTNGNRMFCYTNARTYTISHYKMVNGVKQKVQTEATSNGLKSFTSDLSSLTNGYHMFGSSAENACPLSEESIMIIADTIQDITGLGLTGEDGQLWLGYDTSITDTTNIMNCCNQIAAKGWTVYLNGSQYTSTDSGSTALIDDESSTTPIPHYYKPVQVTNEDCAEYVDNNGKFYIIVGGQHVFGDDISTYGMFTSYEHAITEISLGLGLTPYEKPSEEIIEDIIEE